jgi:carbon storage regulator
MLVLTRRCGESVQIGDQIVITITKIRGNQVSVSIEAPKKVPIVRNELVRTSETSAPAISSRCAAIVGPC